MDNTVSAAAPANCERGRSVIIASRGKPVAKITLAVQNERAAAGRVTSCVIGVNRRSSAAKILVRLFRQIRNQ
jgi:antitoxin (DNA-binding transcriptional repressor) of toxin-antitoxin stability system